MTKLRLAAVVILVLLLGAGVGIFLQAHRSSAPSRAKILKQPSKLPYKAVDQAQLRRQGLQVWLGSSFQGQRAISPEPTSKQNAPTLSVDTGAVVYYVDAQANRTVTITKLPNGKLGKLPPAYTRAQLKVGEAQVPGEEILKQHPDALALIQLKSGEVYQISASKQLPLPQVLPALVFLS